jgi:gluconate 5-dehydrogenase
MANRPVLEQLRLDGRVALVTGGGGHLGSAMCWTLAELGACVVAASRCTEHCAGLAQEIRQAGYHAAAAELDIADEGSCRRAVDGIATTHGRLDILVNNAYPFREKRIDEIANADFDVTLTAAITGTFRLSQLVSLLMRRNGGGTIINIGSMYGMVGSYPDVYEGLQACSSPCYHAAKGGILHLTRHLAVYWAKYGIRVNCISPGAFPKEVVRRDQPEFHGRLVARVPLGRTGRPEELKGAIALLASDAGSYITGANLVVDGGWTAW